MRIGLLATSPICVPSTLRLPTGAFVTCKKSPLIFHLCQSRNRYSQSGLFHGGLHRVGSFGNAICRPAIPLSELVRGHGVFRGNGPAMTKRYRLSFALR